MMYCANPDCRRESRYLRDGSLYCIDDAEEVNGTRSRHFIWLCSACAPTFRVETWRPAGEQLRSPAAAIPETAGQERPQPSGDSDQPRRKHPANEASAAPFLGQAI